MLPEKDRRPFIVIFGLSFAQKALCSYMSQCEFPNLSLGKNEKEQYGFFFSILLKTDEFFL